MEQLQSAKVVFITGGETGELVNDMLKYPGFVESIKGKVVAGSSAGAYLFARHYFSSDGVVYDGLGTLPIKIIGHYGNPEFGGVEESRLLLETHGEDLEMVVLEECEWIVREVEL